MARLNAFPFVLIRRCSGGRQVLQDVASASPGRVSAEEEVEASWLPEQEAAAEANTHAAQAVEASWLAEREARVVFGGFLFLLFPSPFIASFLALRFSLSHTIVSKPRRRGYCTGTVPPASSS